MRNLALFSTPLPSELPAFRNAARCVRCTRNLVSAYDGAMFSPFGTVQPIHP